MAKLIVCSDDESVINVTELADAVYQELGQKDGLFAELLYVNEQEIKALPNSQGKAKPHVQVSTL